ncbi:MAG: type II toxin-antitoxin system VapC family toxin [Syntrophomonadaceae bacterium]|nr:type II toxin-antitoxin system VapC family toxin [Syntrophomonadaceae bacterium]
MDTHTVLWCAANSENLSGNARGTLLDPATRCFVSIVSAWEVAIKASIGRMILAGDVSEFYRITYENGFAVLPVRRKHLAIVETLPFHHRDLSAGFLSRRPYPRT